MLYDYKWVFREADIQREDFCVRKKLLSFIPACILGLLFLLAPFYSLDSMICDKLYQKLSGPRPDIKIICVDEETLGEYGKFENWSRQKAAELVELLCKDMQTAPSVVAFDFMFTGESDAETDQRLADACEKAGNVVMATNLVYRGETKKTQSGEVYFDEWNIETEEYPYEALKLVTDSGYTNVQMAKDGFVRYAQLFTQTKEGLRNSFAYEIYQKYSEENGVKVDIPMHSSRNQVAFRYSGDVGEYYHVSLRDVLNGTIPTSEFTDCIVLIGAYAPGFQDAYQVSVNRGKSMYGVEINANILQAFMEGKTAVDVKVWIHAAIMFFIILLYFYIAVSQKLLPAVIEGIAIMVLHMGAGRLLALRGYRISQVYVLIILTGCILYFIVEKYLLEKIKRRRVLAAFKRYMAPQVVDKLAASKDFESCLGGEKREVAVLFVDIRGFTTMSESLKPEEVVKILNEYLALTTSCILKNEGMLDKFIGDATMAVFNAPFDQNDYCMAAIKTAWDIQQGGKELGEKLLEKYGKTVQFGVGVHCGEAVVGNIGCEFRMDYTAIGDTVNTASRLEGKARPGEVLISEAIYEKLQGRIEGEILGELELKGKKEKIRVYQLTAVKDKTDEKVINV